MQCTQRLRRLSCAACLIVSLCLLSGCSGSRASKVKAPPLTSRYHELPARDLPPFLKDTILDRCELQNVLPAPISGYGLVSNLRGTGNTYAGLAVREYIRKMMITHRFGSSQFGFDNMQPEDILRDPRFAIVRVDGLIPPGARKHQRFDVLVSALDGNSTSSLAHGSLYRADLKVNGANAQQPNWQVDIWANAEGSLFVNPAYALNDKPQSPEESARLRKATVLNGGVVLMDRPLILRLRKPQLSIARAIEQRLDYAFQSVSIASAKDEALIAVYVPESYNGDWEHFAQIITHMYMNPTPDFAVLKARQLAEEAVKPDAPLLDISYCWEALGPTAKPFITPLMTHEKPDVAFAAARAATWLGDSSAQNVLMGIARTSGHPFQLNAVQSLGKLPSSPVVNQVLRALLDAPENLVRIEAYRALANHDDPRIISRPIADTKFRLDIVPSQGPPIVYASRTGMPRIAVIGNKPRINMPVLFTAMERRFSISSETNRDLISVYYRGQELPQPVSFLCSPDLTELIARLGGEGAPGDKRLDFNYCDVVALLQLLTDEKRLTAQSGNERIPVAFMLQESPSVEQQLQEAPAASDQPTPEPERLGSAQ